MKRVQRGGILGAEDVHLGMADLIKKRLGLSHPVRVKVSRCKIVQRGQGVGMLGTWIHHPRSANLFVKLDGFVCLTGRVVRTSERVQRTQGKRVRATEDPRADIDRLPKL